mgnify:CR=1 FL=1
MLERCTDLEFIALVLGPRHISLEVSYSYYAVTHSVTHAFTHSVTHSLTLSVTQSLSH